jgi:hypothetical protein
MDRNEFAEGFDAAAKHDAAEFARLDKRIAELEAALSTETQRRERCEEEVECTHKWLDEQGAPRADGEALSLIGRIMRLPSAQRGSPTP